MMHDITIGQFFPGNSIIHRMDPRMKLILTFIYIIVIFVCKNFWSLGVMVLALIIMVLLSKVPVKVILKSIKPIAIIITFTAILNIFYVSDGDPLFDWRFIHITTGGIYTAIFMIIRIIALVVASSLLTYTTSPTLITDGIERLLSPLKFMKNSVHTIAMMMTIALRFIPTLVDEFEKITNAQKARGADLETGTLVERAKALVPVLVPLFITSFRRAYELAFAMECRCYHGAEGRTRMKIMKYSKLDAFALLFICVVTGGVVALNILFVHII
ncbi:MAG: energy-coupling factor transporter transmembrane protein EcfT [Oscillospiraceae bacterium]|nr:energy-coupling factor transporter transmembrane protein EcfT [Candidatus Limimonas egerieequi]